MSRTLGAVTTLVVLLSVSAAGQVPPRYEIVTIDPDPTFNYYPRMNNHGQIVYSAWFDGFNHDAIDIFLYDNGETIRLTDDDTFDRLPDINDAGQIVWCRAVEGPDTPPQIVLWEDGELTQLTFDDRPNRGPRISNLGHIVWKRYMGEAPNGAMTMDLFFWDGQEIQRLTYTGEGSAGIANQGHDINDRDQIVWTEYDFSVNPWTSRVMMWDDGETTQLSPPEQLEPQGPSINNPGSVTWDSYEGAWLWRDGEITFLTDWGTPNAINDRGEIVIGRGYDVEPVGASEVWLYRNGNFYQITDEPHDQGWENVWNTAGDMNNRGEIVFNRARPWYYEAWVKCLRLRLDDGDGHQKVAPVGVRPIIP
jgi:hypothetical protein